MNQYGLDITTPYEELEEISVLTKEGKILYYWRTEDS